MNGEIARMHQNHLMIHLCSGYESVGGSRGPHSNSGDPTNSNSRWKPAAGAPSIQEFRVHRASMVLVKAFEVTMQICMARALISTALGIWNTPWKCAKLGHPRARCWFPVLRSLVQSSIAIGRYLGNFQPWVCHHSKPSRQAQY